MTKLTMNEMMNLDSYKLTEYLYNHYHQRTREIIKEIKFFMPMLLNAHKDHEFELLNLNALVDVFAVEMEEHLQKEENILFPMIRNYVVTGNEQFKMMVSCPIDRMELDHDDHMANLEKFKSVTNNFTPPAGSCGTYNRTIALVKEMYDLTVEHIDVENSVLFRRMK